MGRRLQVWPEAAEADNPAESSGMIPAVVCGGQDPGAEVPAWLQGTERSVPTVPEEEGWQENEEQQPEERRAKAESCCRPG